MTSIPYFGDKGGSPIQAVALDQAGNIYIAGTTAGEIPLVNALQPKLGGGNCGLRPTTNFSPCPNIFVAKFDPTGTKLIYSTYLGGDQSDYAAGIAVDRDGNAYITGTTRPAAPTLTPSEAPARNGNAFVKKLNPLGSALLYTRYLGGDTTSNGIAVDANGDAYIAGYSLGADFPSVRPLPVQPSGEVALCHQRRRSHLASHQQRNERDQHQLAGDRSHARFDTLRGDFRRRVQIDRRRSELDAPAAGRHRR